MSAHWKSAARAVACAGAAAVIGTSPIGMGAQAPPAAAQAPAPAGGGRGGSPIGPQLFTIFDGDKDGSVTAAELKTAFVAWYDSADTQKSGSVSQEQLSAALNAALGPPAAPAPGAGGFGGGFGRGGQTEFVAGATTPGLNEPCGGRSQHPTIPCASDVEQMMAALADDGAGQADEATQSADLLAHSIGRIPALVDSAGCEGGRGARQEDGRMDVRRRHGTRPSSLLRI